MSSSVGLVELVSAALARADIPHECYATLTTSNGRPVNVGIAVPSEVSPLGAIVCGFVEEFEDFFVEELGGEYDMMIPGLSPLTVCAASQFLYRAVRLKTNRDRPILCVAVVDSLREKLRKRPLREYLCETFDEAFLKRDLDKISRFVKRAFSDPSFEVIEERLWKDERGIKRVSKRRVPIKVMLWSSKELNNKKGERLGRKSC